MLAPDVNVLIYAFRAELPEHPAARRWLVSALAGPEPVVLLAPVMHGFLRIVTNHRAFRTPTPLAQAVGFVDELLGSAGVPLLGPGPGHWDRLRGLCQSLGLKANDIADAALAALAIEHGCEFVTADSGFRRFPGLRWRNPLIVGGSA